MRAREHGFTAERGAWVWVIAWSLGIFVTIPLARTFEAPARAALGENVFGWFAIAAVLTAATAGCVALVQRRRAGPAQGSPGWLLGVAVVFLVAISRLWSNPEEAMHFVQYGALAWLLHRALAYRIHDRSIYLVAALVGTAIGCIDEAIQWATPMRFFGLRDIGLNAFAGALVQIAIAMGIRPGAIRPQFEARGLRTANRIAAAVWLLLLAFALNTPERVNAYADRVAALSFLADNPSSMIEYGFLHRDPAIGVFRSRLSAAALRRQDEERGLAVGDVAANWQDGYAEFLAAYPAQRDPYAYEFRVHLFRRDAHRVHRERTGADARRRNATVVASEEEILRRFFPKALAASGFALSPELEREIAQERFAGASYESPVSVNLVTGVAEWQVLLAFAAGLIGFVLLDRVVLGPRIVTAVVLSCG